MKGSRRHKENVVGLNLTVSRVDCRALDDGKNVPLDTLSADVRPPGSSLGSRSNFIDLIDEDDAILLGPTQCLRLQLVLIHQPSRFVSTQQFASLRHRHLALLRLLRKESLEHVLEPSPHRIHPLSTEELNVGGVGRTLRQLDIDHALVEVPFTEHSLELLSRPLGSLTLGV